MYQEGDGCLDDNKVAAFAEGNVQPEERARIEAHLAQCAFCREIVVAVFNTLVEPQKWVPEA
jgi:predicted anti-sigma-YlaC factor YlaD